ncbi:hypothetical protein CEF21_18115 [Bacillus sp. FJAT-42376]|nr:hypothetical protein CEF21_18115 [Bacillus sp. FJAT-42376]
MHCDCCGIDHYLMDEKKALVIQTRNHLEGMLCLLNWKEHFINDIALNFRMDSEDLEAAIETYVSELSDGEVLQLTKTINAEELRDLLAQSILDKAERNSGT